MALQRTRRPRIRSGRSLRSLGSPLNACLLGAARPAVIAVLAVIVTSIVQAEIRVTMGPSPAGKALRTIASGKVTAELLGDRILEAAGSVRSRTLLPRLLDVLDAYSRQGEVEAGIVADAFAFASRKAVSRSTVEQAQETLRLRLKNSPKYSNQPDGWFHHDPRIALDEPVTAKSRSEWPQYVFHDRLASLLDAELPQDDRREYVREALRAYLAGSCQAFLGGKLVPVCQEVGLSALRYEAIRLAFGGLRSDGSDPTVADLYLSQGTSTLEQVLETACLMHPGGFGRECSILYGWMKRAPSRWEVWADLEPDLY